MSKYRIIQTKDGFKSQKRFLWFWKNTQISDYFNYDQCVYEGMYRWTVISESLEKAKDNLNIIRSFPRKYHGHKIKVGYRNGCYYYVDTQSLTSGINDDPCYTRWANSYEDLIAEIDEFKEKKRKEKEAEKILKIIEL